MKTLRALLLCLFVMPALAEPNFGDISLIDGGRQPDKTQILSIKVLLNKGWHSYWRLAGQNGLDPVFDISNSENLANFEIHWPNPALVGEDGLEAVGYEHEAELIVSMTAKDPSQPIKLSLNMDIGVCDVQCVPVHREFEMTLNTGYSIDGVGLRALLDDEKYMESCAPLSTDPTSFVLYDRGEQGAVLTPRDKLRDFSDIQNVYEVSRSGIHQLCE